MFAFIVGLSLFLTNQLNRWGHTEMLCLMSALTMGPGSVWAGSMLCKKTEQLDEYVKIAALSGAGSLLVILPMLMALFYGSDYSMAWVLVTAAMSVVCSFYVYFDIVVFRER
jgi:FtsH-binding integral membrane protein